MGHEHNIVYRILTHAIVNFMFFSGDPPFVFLSRILLLCFGKIKWWWFVHYFATFNTKIL